MLLGVVLGDLYRRRGAVRSPNHFLLRACVVLLVLGLLAHISRGVSRPAFIVQALAQESLTVYAVHLCIV